MKNNELINILEELGLTGNESQVYFSLLSIGPSTILKVSQASELKRTTVYSIIDSLKQKGLVNIQVNGFKKKLVAEKPEKLEVMLEIKRKKLRALLPEFSALYNLQGGESFLKNYEGLEAVKSVYESLIRDIKPGEDYLVFSSQDDWLSLDKEYFMDFLQRRAQLPIKIKMIFTDTPLAHEWKKMSRNFNSLIKILPKDIDFKSNLVVTPQRLLIHQLTPPVMGIVIENKSIIKLHKEMYEVIWRSLQ
jgi:sugar-specific transcriptional regulator TrmB